MAQSEADLTSDLQLGRLVWTPGMGSCLPGPPLAQRTCKVQYAAERSDTSPVGGSQPWAQTPI